MKVVAAILYLSGGIVFGWAICFGDWVTAIAMAVAAAMVSLPSVIITQEVLTRDAHGKIQGSIHAGNAAFMRELKTMDLQHSSQIRQLASAEGAAAERAKMAEDKIHRMTNRPRVRGRLAKKTDAALEGPRPPSSLQESTIDQAAILSSSSWPLEPSPSATVPASDSEEGTTFVSR